jgi:hypothetical protein
MRGTAYGLFNAAIGITALPASLIARVLWQGAGEWMGFGPAAPFLFGAGMTLLAGLLFLRLVRSFANIQFRRWLCNSIIGRKIQKPLTMVRINNV